MTYSFTLQYEFNYERRFFKWARFHKEFINATPLNFVDLILHVRDIYIDMKKLEKRNYVGTLFFKVNDKSGLFSRSEDILHLLTNLTSVYSNIYILTYQQEQQEHQLSERSDISISSDTSSDHINDWGWVEQSL